MSLANSILTMWQIKLLVQEAHLSLNLVFHFSVKGIMCCNCQLLFVNTTFKLGPKQEK